MEKCSSTISKSKDTVPLKQLKTGSFISCTKCDLLIVVTEQRKRSGSRVCTGCKRIADKLWVAKNLERKRELCREYHRKHRQRRRKVNREIVRRYRSKNREKANAQAKLNYAVKKGYIKRLPCEVCGKEKAHGHHTDYSKALDVTWLCPVHHEAEHHAREQ